jgi:hypothetical protein
MRKKDEIANPLSCFNRAADEEMLFVLRARDIAAAPTIRAWAARRIELGKNKMTDAQIGEALRIADAMEHQQRFGVVS